METLSLRKENIEVDKRLPYFVEIVRNEKRLRIPCVNKEIAKKVLLSLGSSNKILSK